MRVTDIRRLALLVGCLSWILFTACSSGGSGGDDDDSTDDDDTAPTDDDNDDDDDTSPTDDDTSPTDDDSADDDTSPPTTCLIEGVTYNDGDTNPLNACLVCDPSESTDTWTMNDGAACDDGVYCNGADVCLGGMCSVHNGDPCPDDGLFCNGPESCDEVYDQCNPPADPCGTDETCQEPTDFCLPDPHTCHGAAYSTHDLCGYVLQNNDGDVLNKAQIESWCDSVEAEYGKMQGVFFDCLDTCARDQSCNIPCMDACATPADPGGSGCDHVVYELYSCNLAFPVSPGSEYIFPESDAYNLCDGWSYDWACYQICYEENAADCSEIPPYPDNLLTCLNQC